MNKVEAKLISTMAGTSSPSNETSNLAFSGEGNEPSLRSPHDIVSNYEVNEGPVREKLKKTSITSLSGQVEPYSRAEPEEEQRESDKKNTLQAKILPTDGNPENDDESRGRPIRKRSFEDPGVDKQTENEFDKAVNRSYEGRQRKRSKDVHANRVAWTETQERGLLKSPVSEEVEEVTTECEIPVPNTVANTLTRLDSEHRSAAEDIADQEMSDHLFSPRKKRSRDPLDADPHREQKIVATEEARAHRRSEEFERSEILPIKDKGEQMNGTMIEGPTPEHVERLTIKEVYIKASIEECLIAYTFLETSGQRLHKHIHDISFCFSFKSKAFATSLP